MIGQKLILKNYKFPTSDANLFGKIHYSIPDSHGNMHYTGLAFKHELELLDLSYTNIESLCLSYDDSYYWHEGEWVWHKILSYIDKLDVSHLDLSTNNLLANNVDFGGAKEIILSNNNFADDTVLGILCSDYMPYAEKINLSNVTYYSYLPNREFKIDFSSDYEGTGVSEIILTNFTLNNMVSEININNVDYFTNLNLNTFVNTSNLQQIDKLIVTHCENLTTLTLLPGSLLNISGNNDFKINYNPSLTSINCTGDINLSTYDSLKELFNECTALTNVNNVLSHIVYTSSARADITRMFHGCESLTSIDFSNLRFTYPDVNNKLELVDMSGLFSGCKALTSVSNLNKLNTSGVRNMSSLFSQCEHLTSLNVSALDTSSATNIASMFNECSRLTSLNINHFDVSNLQNTGFLFYGCSSLSNLQLPNFIFATKLRNTTSMFEGCSSLTSLQISLNGSVNDTGNFGMSSMFKNCSSLTSLDLSGFHIPKSTISPTSYSNSYAVLSLASLFEGCSSLTSLSLPNFDETSSVHNFSSMFKGCSSLTSLDLSNFDFSNTYELSFKDFDEKYFDEMFKDCTSLTTVTLPSFYFQESDASAQREFIIHYESMFENCSNLRTVSLKDFYCYMRFSMNGTNKYANGTHIANMFKNCTRLQTIYTDNTNRASVWWSGGDWSFEEQKAYFKDTYLNCQSLVGGNGTNYIDNVAIYDEEIAAAGNDWATADIDANQTGYHTWR